MRLFEHIRGEGGDEPAELLRHNPSVLLPASATAEDVTALVRTWSPDADPSGDGSEVAEGIRWYGPIDLTDDLVAAAELRLGRDALLSRGSSEHSFAIAYVARCHRSRMLRSSLSRRYQRWSQRFTNDRLGLDPTVSDRADDELEEHYPGGLPTGVEAHAWNLVRGVARGFGGVALLPENPGFTPGSHENPGAVVYAATALSPEQARPLLVDLAPGLDEDPDEELTSSNGFWLLTAEGDGFSVVADIVEGDDRPPVVRDLGERLTAYDATADDDALEHAVAQRLAEATGGVVLDEFGFRR